MPRALKNALPDAAELRHRETKTGDAGTSHVAGPPRSSRHPLWRQPASILLSGLALKMLRAGSPLFWRLPRHGRRSLPCCVPLTGAVRGRERLPSAVSWLGVTGSDLECLMLTVAQN